MTATPNLERLDDSLSTFEESFEKVPDVGFGCLTAPSDMGVVIALDAVVRDVQYMHDNPGSIDSNAPLPKSVNSRRSLPHRHRPDKSSEP